MSGIAVMTDSNCGYYAGRRQENWEFHVIPMPVIIDGRTYFEGVDITAEDFYKKQAAGAEITYVSAIPRRCHCYVG